MAENRGFLVSGSHQQRQSDGGFRASMAAVPDNQFMSPGDATAVYQRFLNPMYDSQLELDFSRLNLLDPLMRDVNYYNGFGGGAGVADSSVRSSLASNMPFAHPQFIGDDIQRMRSQLAASGQIGLQVQQPPNFHVLADPQINSDPFSISGDLNSLSNYGNFYGSVGRSLSAAAIGYRPRRNGFRYGQNQLYYNRSTPNFRMESNNSASLVSDRLANRTRHRLGISSLDELGGRIAIAAKDQAGCRFLQNKFDEGKPEDIHLIFSEVKGHVCELMIDQFGNYLIQKLFEVCCEDQITQLLLIVVQDEWKFKDICIDMHGTRAVQKLLEHLTTSEQKSVAVSVLRRITVALTKSMNGHHVIQHCLKFLSPEDTKHILNVVANNCLDIATDKSGCCVLQQCVAHAQGEPRERLIAEISSNALILSEHPYGNYVVQYVLGLRMPQVTAEILAQLSGCFVSLSTNKYGSNVIEKCLKEAEGDQVLRIINEIISSPNFLRVLQDPYGNYVAQSVFAMSKGAVRAAFQDLITLHYAFLHSHPHGKRVLACTKGNHKLRV